MKQAKDLAAAMKNMVDKGDHALRGKVVSVDKNKAACEVEINGLEIGEVRLQANIKTNQKGFKVYPLQGSDVIVERLGREGDFFVSMVSEVEEVLLEIGNVSLQITDGFLLKKNNDTAEKILSDFVDEVMKIVVPTNVGPSGNPINNPAFAAIKNRIKQLFK
jgi:hypothetical protein